MSELTFEALYAKLQDLFNEKDYEAALVLAGEGAERYPEHRMLLDYWRMTMAARLERREDCLGVLRSTLARGQWYGEVLLRKSPSLKYLQGEPDFEALVDRNRELAEVEQQEIYPLYTLRPEGKCQSGRKACPLLVGLHSNGGTVQTSLGFWRPAATAGWLVAAPQSTQAMWRGAYIWDNREIAESETTHHFAALRSSYSVDVQHMVLAGHSLGGEIAIWLALKGGLEVSGFLAIGPGGAWMDDLSEWEPLLHENAALEQLRGYFIVGEKDDTIPQDNVRRLAEMLAEAGVACRLEVVEGVGHDFEAAYEPAVLRALQYINHEDTKNTKNL